MEAQSGPEVLRDAILAYLAWYGDTSPNQLGISLGMNREELSGRVKSLEEDGLIHFDDLGGGETGILARWLDGELTVEVVRNKEDLQVGGKKVGSCERVYELPVKLNCPLISLTPAGIRRARGIVSVKTEDDLKVMFRKAVERAQTIVLPPTPFRF